MDTALECLESSCTLGKEALTLDVAIAATDIFVTCDISVTFIE